MLSAWQICICKIDFLHSSSSVFNFKFDTNGLTDYLDLSTWMCAYRSFMIEKLEEVEASHS